MKIITENDVDFLAFLGKQESQNIIPAFLCINDVLDAFRHGDVAKGDPLPWIKTQSVMRFRPGEVSIWGAYNGHGKSLMLGMFASWNMQLNRKWLIASMEMTPASTIQRMIMQSARTDEPSENYIQRYMDWTEQRLWIYDQLDTVDSDRILGMIHYAAQEIGIDHIVIDSLMKCGFKGSRDVKSGKQVDFVDKLCWAAKANNIHIHLVHHMRKGEGTKSEYQKPGKHDFRGAGEIVDLVDNALIVHRNKKKEELIAKGEQQDENIPDVTLSVVKQRHFPWEGAFKLWFDTKSQQYMETPQKIMLNHEV